MGEVVFTVTVAEDGSIVLPEELRERRGIQPGDELAIVAYGERISVLLKPPGDPVARLHGMLKDGPSLTEALLEDRREELEREERGLPPPRRQQ